MSARVGVVLGSATDAAYAKETTTTLDGLGIAHEVRILSAHRTPRELEAYVSTVRERGLKVLIGLAGHAAALPGVMAALTRLPVIGVPLPTSDLQGHDALLAVAQMPPGVPVATMAVGKPGARNAAYLAAAILALNDDVVAAALEDHRRTQAERVLADDAKANDQ